MCCWPQQTTSHSIKSGSILIVHDSCTTWPSVNEPRIVICHSKTFGHCLRDFLTVLQHIETAIRAIQINRDTLGQGCTTQKSWPAKKSFWPYPRDKMPIQRVHLSRKQAKNTIFWAQRAKLKKLRRAECCAWLLQRERPEGGENLKKLGRFFNQFSVIEICTKK